LASLRGGPVRAWVWSCVICGRQSGAGVGFLGVLRFPLPIFITPIAPQSQSITIIHHLGLVQQASGGRSTKWTQSHPSNNNNNNNNYTAEIELDKDNRRLNIMFKTVKY
jgi:hypothetical protein